MIDPSQFAINSNDESSSCNTVASKDEVEGHASLVVYTTLYVDPFKPPVTVPVSESIIAPSSGSCSKENTPPSNPVIMAVIDPSQLAVNSNDESSGSP